MGAICGWHDYACTLTVGVRSGGRIDDCLGEDVLSLRYTDEMWSILGRMMAALEFYCNMGRWWLYMDCEFVNYMLGLGWALVATVFLVQTGEDSYGWVHSSGGGVVARSGVGACSRSATAGRWDDRLGGSTNCFGGDWRCDTVVRLCRSWVGVCAVELDLWEEWGRADTVRCARYSTETWFECLSVAGHIGSAIDVAWDVSSEAGRVVPISASGRVASRAVRGMRSDALRLRGGELIGECRPPRIEIQDVRCESQDVRRDVCASWKEGPDRRISERCSWRSRLGEQMAPAVVSVEGPRLGGFRDRACVAGGSRMPHEDGLDRSVVLDRAQTMRSPPSCGGGVLPEVKADGEDVWGRGAVGVRLEGGSLTPGDSSVISPATSFSTPGSSSNSSKSEIESGTNATMGMRGSGRSRSVVPPYTGVRRTPDETKDAADEESDPDGGEAGAPGGGAPECVESVCGRAAPVDEETRAEVEASEPMWLADSHGVRAARGGARRRAGVRFLQFYVRRSLSIGRRWTRGGLRGLVLMRREVQPQCCHGQSLASEADFERQREVAEACILWYEQWVRLLRRLDSGRTPLVIDLFVGAGGASEGARRVGARSVGVDCDEQPSFVARFGKESFLLNDALDRERLRELVRRFRPIGVLASPPCEGYSSATFAGAGSSAAKLIAEVREMLVGLGLPFVIENVLGARDDMAPSSVVLRGQFFGLHTSRPRFFESGGGLELTVDAPLRDGGLRLAKGCCLGAKARFSRIDSFGRRVAVPCCQGNIFAVQGRSPMGGTLAEHAAAMDLDVSHMPYASMAKAIPPAYAAYCVGQMAMFTLRRRFGVRTIGFTEMLRRPVESRRYLAHLLQGAGHESAGSGVRAVPRAVASSGDEAPARSDGASSSRLGTLPIVGCTLSDWSPEVGERVWYAERGGGRVDARVEAVVRGGPHEEDSYQVWLAVRGVSRGTVLARLSSVEGAPEGGDALDWHLGESDLREIDYTHAGGFDQHWQPDGSAVWLDRLRPARRMGGVPLSCDSWLNRNTLVHVPTAELRRALPGMRAALATRMGRARMTVIMPLLLAEGADSDDVRADMIDAGFEQVLRFDARHTRVCAVGGQGQRRLAGDVEVWHAGWRECEPGLLLDHAAVSHLMDVRDRTPASEADRARKAAVSWTPMPEGDAKRWAAAGLPPRVVEMMTRGVVVDAVPGTEAAAGETPQYPWPDDEHYLRGVMECDRAMVAGHLEVVPEGEVAESLRLGHVHPWTVVHQSADKWRAAQDYSVCTNRRVVSKPFTLTSVQEVQRVVGPDSHFAKFDLRDGFWSVPTCKTTRHHLMVRHPATGQLLRCRSLPFGYGLSPLHFCELTEAIGAVFRRRTAGMGLHIFVFVDDFLVVGPDGPTTQKGIDIFRALLLELCLPSAAHKERGPARVMEFLGFLLVNRAEAPCVSLTAKRQARMQQLIAEWQARRPADGGVLSVCPREMASTLGHLIFCSAVIPDGRTYMQGMLRQFKGLEVDWQRGAVRSARSHWRRLEVSGAFWRDLRWWATAFERANCVPMRVEEGGGECVLAGSDASDFGCGELVWVDGEREETQLVFTRAERRRPINFRELRGALRVLELWAPRLSGRTLVIELDNSASVGAASKLYSKAEDMQELVRRILECCQRHGIRLRLTHTPGRYLTRPDRLSRSLMPEQPRLRFSRVEFDRLESRFGPFDEFVGAERSLVCGARPGSRGCSHLGGACLWVHPSFDTVAASLRMIGERLTTSPSTCVHGLVVLPFAPTASWWTLTRHLREVGRFGVGSGHLQANLLGRWVPARARRETVIFSFPRVAGLMAVPLSGLISTGSQGLVPGLSRGCPLPAGARLYSPLQVTAEVAASQAFAEQEGLRAGKAAAGCLYLTLEPYDGEGEPVCAWLRRSDARSADPRLFVLDRDSYQPGGAPFRPWASELWLVDGAATRAQASSRAQPKWWFDPAAAEADIRAFGGAQMQQMAELHAAEVEQAAASLAALAVTEPDSAATVGDEAGGDAFGPMSGLRARGEATTTANRETTALGALPAEAPRGRQPVSLTGGEVMRNQHRGAVCRGCDRLVGDRAWVSPHGSGLVCNRADCWASAESRRQTSAEVESESADAGAQPAMVRGADRAGGQEPDAAESPRGAALALQAAASPAALVAEAARGQARQVSPSGALVIRLLAAPNQRQVQQDAALGEARRRVVRACLAGGCGRADPHDMHCSGCQVGLHGVACAQLTKGYASIGSFRCPTCRVSAMRRAGATARSAVPEVVRDQAERAMLHAMVTSSEGLGASFADLASLQARWCDTMALCDDDEHRGLVLPLEGAESFMSFLLWIVTSAGRARSLESIWVAASSLMAKRCAPNLTAVAEVRAYYDRLRVDFGSVHSPKTACTQRMARLTHTRILPRRHEKSVLMLSRARVVFGLEAGGGLRIGETSGGGDHHGLLADNTRVVTNSQTGECFVEVRLEHSKTRFARWVTIAGTTEGEVALPMAQYLRAYWRAAGFTMRAVEQDGGYSVERPDYTVVRVSTLGMSAARLELLFQLCEGSSIAEVKRHSAATRTKGGERWRASGSLDKKYVNVVGGAAGDRVIGATVTMLLKAGFTEAGLVSTTAGPLVRATRGSNLLTHMPLQPQTASEMSSVLQEAWDMANADPADPDPQRDLEGRDSPVFGEHSLRRLADTVARRTMEQTGATEMDLDLMFGWQEKMYSRKMQIHYEQRFTRERRAKVTSLL